MWPLLWLAHDHDYSCLWDNGVVEDSFKQFIDDFEDIYQDNIFQNMIYDKLNHEQAYIRWLIREMFQQQCGVKFKQLPNLVFRFLPPFQLPMLYDEYKLDIFHKLMEFHFPKKKWESKCVYKTRIFKQNFKCVKPFLIKHIDKYTRIKKKRRLLMSLVLSYYNDDELFFERKFDQISSNCLSK